MHARVHVAYASTRGSGCATEAATASATPAATHRRQGLKRHDAVRATKGPPLTSSAPLSLFSPLSPARDTSEWREHARIARRSWRRWCCNCAHDAGWDLFFELGCEVCVCEGCLCAGEGEREREICRLYALAAAPSITQRPRRFDGSVGIATPRNKHAWMYAHMHSYTNRFANTIAKACSLQGSSTRSEREHTRGQRLLYQKY